MGEIRDPIHGFIDLAVDDRTQWGIISSSIVQRLRRIRQLALANLVYPGANHTRFDHSLGVMCLAGRAFDKIFPTNRHASKQLVRLAGLLHDIGHGPFSHISEYVWSQYARLDQSSTIEEFHESISTFLIENDPELRGKLSDQDRVDIINILKKKTDRSLFMSNLITGPLDADKMDYFLRDSYYCGVEYGKYDLPRLLNVLAVHGKTEVLCVREEGINTLEQFYLAKYYLTLQVYNHRVRRCSDEMIVRAMQLGIECDEIDVLRRLYCVERLDQDYIDFFKLWWDERLLAKIAYETSGYASHIFQMLLNRQLFRYMRFDLSESVVPDAATRYKLKDIDRKNNRAIRDNVEKAIAKIIGSSIDEKCTIVTSKKKLQPYRADDEKLIVILLDSGEVSTLSQHSDLIERLNERIDKNYLEIFFPMSKDAFNQTKQKLQIELSNYLKGLKL